MRPVLIIVALMLLILANSKYYLISTRGEAGQEISGAGDDADKNKTGDEANQKKLVLRLTKVRLFWMLTKKKLAVMLPKIQLLTRIMKLVQTMQFTMRITVTTVPTTTVPTMIIIIMIMTFQSSMPVSSRV